jgi:restriction endonuclease S subunit
MKSSILQFSELHVDNPTLRVDAEFFDVKYQKITTAIKSGHFDYMGVLTSWITQGPNPVFVEHGTPCLTGRNINKGRVSYDGADYVDDCEYKALRRFQLKPGDTLITLKGKGSIGKIGYVTSTTPAIFSRDIGLVRPSSINPAYLAAFILSYHGRELVQRGETGGTGQSTLATSYLKLIPIPRFEIEGRVADVFSRAESYNHQALETYQQVASHLNEELKVSDWKPVHQLNFARNFSDTMDSQRLDAEYFQPKYDEIVNAIKGYKGGFKTLAEMVEIKDKNFTPKLDQIYKYIELSNVGNAGEIEGFTEELGADLPSRARRKVRRGQIIISTIEGSLQSVALIPDELEGALCSTGFFAVEPTEVNAEVLLVFLKSAAGQLQLKRGCKGTILTAFSRDELEKIVIPIIGKPVQEEIRQKVQEATVLRRQSKALLEIAKRGVEIAVEQDEFIAEAWIDERLSELEF